MPPNITVNKAIQLTKHGLVTEEKRTGEVGMGTGV
jgi:hypothetical protein